jgi:tetratricopeptide (TPR) repeat protein
MKRMAPLLWAAALLALVPAVARADEIVYEDPDSCALVTVRAHEIVSETWTEISYKERQRGAAKSVPTAMVTDIRRADDTPQVRDLRTAIGELRRGNFAEAVHSLGDLSGGGYGQDLGTGERRYRNFGENDPPGRNQRPSWISEYAHFFYAKALLELAVEKDDRDLFQEAYMALEDQPVPGTEVRTGGFLERFKGGNSRFFPEAMLLKAKALVGLRRYEDAAKAFEDLSKTALSVDIGPTWYYEALLGPGVIAEAEDNHLKAIQLYDDAANSMRLMLEQETRGCLQRKLGRLYSRARMHAAAVMLRQAEQNRSPAEFRSLKEYIERGSPEALARTYRSLPTPQLEALVAGAMDPQVQAVAQNGIGLAYLEQNKFEEAILTFRSVEVKYFEVPEEHARALHYLARAADGAAKAAGSDEARALYESYRDAALQRLRSEYPNSRWSQ